MTIKAAKTSKVETVCLGFKKVHKMRCQLRRRLQEVNRGIRYQWPGIQTYSIENACIDWQLIKSFADIFAVSELYFSVWDKVTSEPQIARDLSVVPLRALSFDSSVKKCLGTRRKG